MLKSLVRSRFALAVGAAALVAACSSQPEQSLGGTCSADTECATGLHCRNDSVQWLAHEQCTMACESGDECTSRFGANSACLSGTICVRTCSSDADCPSSTVCTASGTGSRWCRHGGRGTGVPSCEGTPQACSALSTATCDWTPGCRRGGSCEGVSDSCSYQHSIYACGMQEGCSWDSGRNTCGGISRSCYGLTSGTTCRRQAGCRWRDTCTGNAPTACEGTSKNACEQVAGCEMTGG